MKNCRTLIAALIGILILASSATGIQVSVSSSAGGFTEVIDAGFNDRVTGSTTIGSDRLSNSIVGEGSLKESHSVSNTAGASAEVGVDIRDAEWYSYSYDLWPGQGSNWKAAKFPQVVASEDLDVLNASYIQAYADAFNSKGHRAGVSTVISDTENEASLIGYSNLAMASKNEAFASQTADWASSPSGYIQAETSADFTQMKSRPLRFSEDKAESNIRVNSGFIEEYSDLASASDLGVAASQQIDTAIGEQIQTGSLASSRSASLFQGLMTERAKVNTRFEGSLTGYNASARNSDGTIFADQTGHFIGSFTSTATAGSSSTMRSSNYGDIYDFAMQAKKNASGSYSSGTLGYYVDNVSPTANRIQGAVDAAESGDVINVLPGTYFENVAVDKSLEILGAGIGESVVDGNRAGSVFKVGTDNSDIDVTLSGMAITNGDRINGGGIYNEGRTIIKHCLVQRNRAYYDGGGISNIGIITVIGSNISENTAYYGDGGGIYNEGTAVIACSNILKNKASSFGGGMSNRGSITITDSNISENTAEYTGGAIFNYAIANITNSILLGNTAYGYGGGLCNGGISVVNGNTISKNSATYGGGICNWGFVSITDNAIVGNTAYFGGGVWSEGSTTINYSTITDSTISHNSAINGGGIYISVYPVTVTGSNISENQATESGGGIYSNFGNTNILENSTITLNIADSDNDGSGNGGGIHNYGMYATLNFIDADGDGFVDPNTIVFDNHLGNGDVNNIEPPLTP